MSCVCLHNLMRIRYPQLQNAAVDQEDNNHQVVPGAWREGRQMVEVEVRAQAPNRDTQLAKAQRTYLKHYFNSPAGAVPWQNDMI